MKKILFVLILFAKFAFANHFLYQQALEFENKGDLKSAIEIYKKIAKNSLNLSENLEKSLKTNNDTNKTISLKHDPLDKFNPIFDIDYYEPMFFLWSWNKNSKKGREQGEVKFQFSFQKPFMSNLFGFDEIYSFAYTQTSWWQVMKNSSPFRESNYKPELFVSFPLTGYFDYLKFGLLHESNGRDEENSRSWNKIYATSKLDFGNFIVKPRIWHPFFIDKTNSDISKYLGYGDLQFEYLNKNSKFLLLLRNNLKLNKNRGAAQFSWEYGLKNGLNFYLQYFTGYGENLMDYKDSVDKISIGFSISN